jgi:FkbH-like protein
MKSIPIALLGNSTTDFLAKSIVKVCDCYQLAAQVYNCPYQQYHQEILNPDSEFYKSAPELTILFLEGSVLFPAWYEWSTLMKTSEEKQAMVQSVFDSLVYLIEEIHRHCDTKILVHNFNIPYCSPLGILDNKKYPGLRDMISLLNDRLSQWAANRDFIYIFEYRGFVSRYGELQLEDTKMRYAAKTPISLKYTDTLAKEYMKYILPLSCLTKKCLVLDLDETLWGGIAGEDGIAGVKLDITGTGRSFYDFQKEILTLYEKGILLAVNSKNNYEDAMNIIEHHPHMLLRKHYFSVLKINWQDKVKNLMEIAEELNIGTDSLVFFDDSRVERELVRAMLPEVTVIEVPEDTSKYCDVLGSVIEFERLTLTGEDLARNTMYAENQQRAQAQKKFNQLDDYLKSLETKVIVEPSSEFTLPRIAQLTQKTNQFNMTTKRYSLEELKRLHDDPDHFVLTCQVTDLYGDNGITGVCIGKRECSTAEIDSFLLSCRVLGRKVEYAFLSAILRKLHESGIQQVYARYKPTEKNKQNNNFYANAGFLMRGETGEERIYCFDGWPTLRPMDGIETVVKGDFALWTQHS